MGKISNNETGNFWGSTDEKCRALLRYGIRKVIKENEQRDFSFSYDEPTKTGTNMMRHGRGRKKEGL